MAFATDAEVTSLFALGSAGIDRYDLATGKMTTIPLATEIARDAPGEIAYIFDHAWRLTEARFYNRNLYGVDWRAVGDHYRRFLPHIRHWEDLAELLSEMAVELIASHQGARYVAGVSSGDDTASLDLYYDHGWKEAGMRVAEILPGGPTDRAGSVPQSRQAGAAVDSPGDGRRAHRGDADAGDAG